MARENLYKKLTDEELVELGVKKYYKGIVELGDLEFELRERGLEDIVISKASKIRNQKRDIVKTYIPTLGKEINIKHKSWNPFLRVALYISVFAALYLTVFF